MACVCVCVCVCLSRRHCRKCVFCQSQPGAACSPCWTDGPTGASPDSEVGASRSLSSITKRLERLSSTSKLINATYVKMGSYTCLDTQQNTFFHAQTQTHTNMMCKKFCLCLWPLQILSVSYRKAVQRKGQ